MEVTDVPPVLRVVVDDREGRSRLAEALAARWGDVAVGRLPVGDGVAEVLPPHGTG